MRNQPRERTFSKHFHGHPQFLPTAQHRQHLGIVETVIHDTDRRFRRAKNLQQSARMFRADNEARA